MPANSVLPPHWVKQALEVASRKGIVSKPNAGWISAEIETFFRVDERCWMISDEFYFSGAMMVCKPMMPQRKDDPAVLDACQFLAEVLGARVTIRDDDEADGYLHIEFLSRTTPHTPREFKKPAYVHCTVAGCRTEVHCKGLCHYHYHHNRRKGVKQ